MTCQIDPSRILFRVPVWALLVTLLGSNFHEQTSGQEKLASQSPVSAWIAGLRSEEVESRRHVASEIRESESGERRELVPLLSELLLSEKDGQVRLAVLDILTDLGHAASESVPALLQTLRTEYGGKRNEELHQDYRSALALAAIGSREAIDGLRALLTEEKANVRAEAAMALGRIGGPAVSAIPELVPLFGDEEARVRIEASRAAGRVGETATDQLLLVATHEETPFRVGAMVALGLLPAGSPRVTEAVLAAARDPESEVRAAAIRSAGSLRIPLQLAREVLLENLQHPEEAVRAAVVNVLAYRQEWLTQLEAELCELLVASDDGVAWHAAFLLQQSGADAAPKLLDALRRKAGRIEQLAQSLALIGAPVVRLLREAIEDPDPRVRQGAALALGQIRPLSDATVGQLAAGLHDPDREVQAAFLSSIGHLGSRAAPTVPVVREKLRDQSADIRVQAIGILFAAAPRDRLLLADLTKMIGDDDTQVQCRAIDAVRSMGPLGVGALPAVIEKLESADPDVRMTAATMIGSHGRAAVEAVPALMKLLDDPSSELRAIGAETLGQLGAAARPALEKLTAMFQDEHVAVRIAAVGTVGSLELEPEEIRPYLAVALQDEESDVRRAAMRGIRRFGRRGTIFIPDLILLAAGEGQGRTVRRALERYERYGPDASSIPELIDRLNHENEAVRLWAAKFLGLAGPSAVDALPALERLSKRVGQPAEADVLAAIASIKGVPQNADSSRAEDN